MIQHQNSRLIDLTGQSFGKLTVIEYLGKKKWRCRCECGKETAVRGSRLRKGETLSCGCPRKFDLTGRNFGEWVVLKRVGARSYRTPLYECLCSCGTRKTLQSTTLLSGDSSSCGCLPRYKDLTKQKFGRLQPLFKAEGKPTAFVCKCDCGNHTRVYASNLVKGGTCSCGCLCREASAERGRVRMRTHGLSDSRVYRIYLGMIQRCSNPHTANYKLYGAKGIKVDPRWLESFENFLEDMSFPPSDIHTLDRLSNSGDYTKEYFLLTESLHNA